MAEQRPPRSPGTRDYFDRAAGVIPQFTVLNYGFSSEPENTMISSEEPEFYCLRMYEHALGGTSLNGCEVLEVSCGRGGGLAHLAGRWPGSLDRKSTRLNSSHSELSRMPSSA